MGLFASRPEEPFEWAGLPSEPLAERSEAELLEDAPVDPFAISTTAGAASISIDVNVPDSAAPADADSDD